MIHRPDSIDPGLFHEEVKFLVESSKNPRIEISQCCLLFAYWTCKRLGQLGVESMIQAGTAYWPINENPPPDNNAFGYEFDHTAPETIRRLENGELPEMHAWSVVRYPSADGIKYEIVDLTTFYQPMQCVRLLHVDWELPVPDRIWEDPETLNGPIYRADINALVIAAAFLAGIGYEDCLVAGEIGGSTDE